MVNPVGADFAPGDIVGNTYEVIDYIGRGAMGFVYHVRHIGLPKEYALKTLSTEQITETAWLRFQIEAQSIAKMFHPNIITIHNFAVHKAPGRVEQPFYVMDLLAGMSLMEELRDNDPLPLARALSVFSQAASGIGYAHSKGIIHRDIKPGNVMLLNQPDASGATVKIVDFGIAKLTADSEIAQQHLTSAGEVFGSPFYMSPEQGLGQTVDARSDIYSLGVTFFEALTGDLPFKANSAVDIMLLHQSAAVPHLNAFVEGGDFPTAVQTVIERMMAKEPSQRYQNMQEVVADLTAIHFGNPLPSLGSGVVHGQDLGLGRRTMQSQAQDPASELDLDSGFDGEESLQSEVWVAGADDADPETDSGVDFEAATGLATGADTGSQTVLAESGRALTKVSTGSGRPKAQLIFLGVSLAAALSSAAAFIAIKSAGHQAASDQLASASVGKNGVDSAGAPTGTGHDGHSRTPRSHHSHRSHHAHSTDGSHDEAKPKPDEIKEPGESLKSTKPFAVDVHEVKNGKMIAFDFPTDTLIGEIFNYNWTSKKYNTVKAQGHLQYGPTDWLMFIPSRIILKYPQYLKRFRPGDVSGVELANDLGTDAILEAFTAWPRIDDLKIVYTHNVTEKCVASLNKFTKLKKFDGAHSTIGGIVLSRATCWDQIEEFRYSHCPNVTPMLLKLKASKNLRYLDVHESNLTYQDYKAISEISSLRELKFEEELVTLNELKLLANLPKLETIELRDCGLEEKAIPILRQYKSLKKLKMGTPKTLASLREKFRSGLPGVEVE
ncbi:MAG: serine/threonine-protein kinase [Candidatus Obscuribacterales bacterium]